MTQHLTPRERLNGNILTEVELDELVPGQKYIIITDDIDRMTFADYDNKMFKFIKIQNLRYHFNTHDNKRIIYNSQDIIGRIFKLNLPITSENLVSKYLGGKTKNRRMKKSKKMRKTKRIRKSR